MEYRIDYLFHQSAGAAFIEISSVGTLNEADSVARAHCKDFGAVGYKIHDLTTDKVVREWPLQNLVQLRPRG